jgi:hypothetical protein
VEKGYGRVNIMQILYTHVCKWKIVSAETILGRGLGRMQNGVGDEFKYDIFDIV